MFAFPQKPKKQDQKKLTSSRIHTKPSNKSILTPKPKLSIPQSQYRIINKMASIRTLPPFGYLNSDSTNSQHKSIGCSQTDSDIWKQQYQLFQYQNRDTIANLDKQLEDVLETIIIQRNHIDEKIYKLKSKLHEIKTNENQQKYKKIVQISTQTTNQTLNDDFQYGERNNCADIQTQFPQKYEHSTYFKVKLNQLGLGNQKILEEFDIGDIALQTKIIENKMILELLLDKIQQ